MKFRIILCITIGFILSGCSLEEIENQEVEAISFQTKLDRQKNAISIEEAEKLTVELKNSSFGIATNLCGDIIQSHRIKWKNASITDQTKDSIRLYFETNFGKHPLIGIDPDGIHELWNFNLEATQSAPRTAQDPCADDVVRTAIVNEEEIELDD